MQGNFENNKSSNFNKIDEKSKLNKQEGKEHNKTNFNKIGEKNILNKQDDKENNKSNFKKTGETGNYNTFIQD